MKKIFIVLLILCFIVFLESCARISKEVKAKPISPDYIYGSQNIDEILNWCSENTDYIDKAMGKNKYYYIQYGTPDYGVHSKTFGIKDSLPLPGLSTDTYRTPLFSKKEKRLYIEIIRWYIPDKYHIISIAPNEKTKYYFSSGRFFNSFDVSPLETELAYCLREDTTFHIYRYNFQTGSITQLTDPMLGGMFPCYSPDGRSIAYCTHRKLKIQNLQNGKERILVGDSMQKEFPKWSPDGKWIVYQARVKDDVSYDIYKVNVKTGNITQLTFNPGLDANPSFDPSGRYIIYMTSEELDRGKQTINRMDANGGNISPDVNSPVHIYHPCY